MFSALYWLATNKLWCDVLYFVRQPLVLAAPIGLTIGNLGDTMKIGASLQMTYLDAIAPEGILPADEALAPYAAIPVVLTAELGPDIAVTIAVPVGLLGVLLDDLKRIHHSYFIHLADKATERGDMKVMGRAELWYPFFCSILLRVLPATLALLFGTDTVSAFLNAVPAWAMNGLSVADGSFPAFDSAVTIMVIGKRELIPYSIPGFVMCAYTGINTIGIAIIAICIAIFQSQFVDSTGSTVAVDDDKGDF